MGVLFADLLTNRGSCANNRVFLLQRVRYRTNYLRILVLGQNFRTGFLEKRRQNHQWC